MAQDSWYYRQSAEDSFDPVSFEELFLMAREGKLTPQMEVRSGEVGNWFPAADIGGLFEAAESGEIPSLDDFSIVDSSFGMESRENLPSLEGFSIVEEEDKLSSELESQLPRFATLEAVRSKHQKVQWHCRILNQELGPMSAEDLMQLLFDGELAPNDEVKSSAEPEWVPARTVVFLSSSGGDTDLLDSESADADQFVPATGEEVAEEAAEESSESAAEEKTEKKEEAEPVAPPPKPPILKVRARQKWYCKLGGMGYGPIEPHKIKMWAEQERVEPTDLLKLGKKGEWFEAWQIEALQLKKPDPKKIAEEKAAPPEETESAATTPATPMPSQGMPPSMASAPTAAGSPFAATPPAARAKPKIKVQRSNPFEALGPMMDPKILGGIGGVIALVAILFFVPLGDLFSPGGGEELAKFKAIHQEFLTLQKKQASDAEWNSFQSKVEKEIEPIVDELNVSASSDAPQLQQLLWAGRDYLPQMLNNARTEPSRDQEKFENHLKEAERIINKK